ncbi:MAG: class beta-lactamase-related serine hydrolase [Verrucomicrobia bacterium]|nr:class beta-lactamase-related serine hydrolase [Verrucomicrobiota bacterium]
MTLNRRKFIQQTGYAGLGLGLISLTPGCQTTSQSVSNGLPRSTPEAQGVSSAGIQAFLDAIAKSNHELHSFMMLRHGHVIAEGWWAPYGPEYVHTMYSMSKSFTSTAVGFAVAEGRLTVEDKVVSFFPGDLPQKISDNLAALRVKDLLTMSVGNEKEPTGVTVASENWAKTFLAQNITHKPGTVFLYNSAATYMCSAIVQKLTGQKIVDYLRSRLFEPLGITKATWEECPRGINTGGWGLSVQTETLAKFGQLFLQKGKWQGQQIIPATWVDEATTRHILQTPPAKPARPNEKNDWLQGYGYQFWRSQNGAYRGDGAFGQYTIVLPEQDTVIVMTGESPNMQGELDLVWEHLLPALKKETQPENPSAQAKLRQTLAELKLPTPTGQSIQDLSKLAGKGVFGLKSNTLGFTTGMLTFINNSYVLELGGANGTAQAFGALNGWLRHETSLTAPRIIGGGAPKQGTKHKVVGHAEWKDAQTLELTLRYYETPHHETITCKFDGDKISISFLSSINKIRNAKDPRPVLEGTLTV